MRRGRKQRRKNKHEVHRMNTGQGRGKPRVNGKKKKKTGVASTLGRCGRLLTFPRKQLVG